MRTLLAILALAATAHAQSFTRQHLGHFDYWSGSNGYQATGQRLGQFYYFNDNYGSGYSQRLGDYEYFEYVPND